jgi:hypothetical protein
MASPPPPAKASPSEEITSAIAQALLDLNAIRKRNYINPASFDEELEKIGSQSTVEGATAQVKRLCDALDEEERARKKLRSLLVVAGGAEPASSEESEEEEEEEEEEAEEEVDDDDDSEEEEDEDQ